MTATPHNKASEIALAIYGKVLNAVRADHLVRVAVERVGDALFVQGRHLDLSQFDQVWIAGAGKASVSMASALTEILRDRLTGGLIVTKKGSEQQISKVEVVEASHPVPDQSSLVAGERMLEFAEAKNERDLVLFLLSGGASALMEAPVDGISLEDLQAVNQILLASGADIGAMNSVRSRLSRIKAGQLADAFEPATVVVIVLSDVIGNDLQTIGSGPFIPPKAANSRIPTFLDSFPTSVTAALTQPRPVPNLRHPVDHFVVGSISLAIHAAADAAREFGLTALPYADPIRGEARVMARKICRHVAAHERRNYCMIFGGETTVTIKGKGVGGRCQEMALASANEISKQATTCFLAAGTDGADGPTDAAGGLVDPDSAKRAKSAGFSAIKCLAENNSYAYLKACGGLIFTGPTGSNVNDIVLVVHVDD